MLPANLPDAIHQTVAYADLFDHPVSFDELHRYLHGAPISPADLCRALQNGGLPRERVSLSGEWLTLKGREALAAARPARARASAALWQPALHYGARLARLPFVRMVALTGALAMRSALPGGDVDYLIIAETGRVWTCRLFALAVVRLAARRGVPLCPNYFLALDALALDDHSLFTARELAQMIPLSGLDVYRRMRAANPWVDELLPNAGGAPQTLPPAAENPPPLSRLIEWGLRGSWGARLERWEMRRKIEKFSRLHTFTDETEFSAARIQGHFDGYRRKTLDALGFSKR